MTEPNIRPRDLDRAIELAAEIKDSLNRLEDAINELPDCDQRGRVKRLALVHHNRLNKAARAVADLFDTDVETMSGGGDKPPEGP